jgi:drug/metabolite transporter (DMT)-like permease
MPRAKTNARIGKTDLLMVLTILLWAVNLSVIKIGLREFSPHGFNGVRLGLASLVYVAILAGRGRRALPVRGDGWKTLVLGLFGITIYQLFFIRAISLTSASATSIIMATTPLFIALLSSAAGQEKISWAGWLGIGISFAGFVIVVFGQNGGSALTWQGIQGPVLILLSNLCWAAYTVISKPMLDRASAFDLTALATSAGTLVYLPFVLPDLRAVAWSEISWKGWGAVLYSGLVAVVLCFVLWSYSVQKVGSTKTGIYGNLTPVFATVFAAVALSERITGFQAGGALLILGGVYLTRSGYRFLVRGTQEGESRPLKKDPDFL